MNRVRDCELLVRDGLVHRNHPTRSDSYEWRRQATFNPTNPMHWLKRIRNRCIRWLCWTGVMVMDQGGRYSEARWVRPFTGGERITTWIRDPSNKIVLGIVNRWNVKAHLAEKERKRRAQSVAQSPLPEDAEYALWLKRDE